jgi:hypothetical protein
MTDNCLNGQFRYLDNGILHDIKGGTLVAPSNKSYHNRWAVYNGVSKKSSQSNQVQTLKQTAAGSLRFQNGICAEPSATYVMRTNDCDKPEQQFTFGK